MVKKGQLLMILLPHYLLELFKQSPWKEKHPAARRIKKFPKTTSCAYIPTPKDLRLRFASNATGTGGNWIKEIELELVADRKFK